VGLSALREAVVDALTAAGLPVKTDHGFTPHMTLGWNLDPERIQPPDNVPVEFDRMVVAVGEAYMEIPFGQDAGAEASGAPIAGAPMPGEQMNEEGKSMSYDPRIETGPNAGHKSSGAEPGKSFPRLAGTHEEHAQLLHEALCDALLGHLNDETRKQRHLCVDGTWDDRVICTVNDWSHDGPDNRQSYEFPYSTNHDGSVMLGDPTPVKLTITAVVDDEEIDDAEIPIGDLLPFAEMIETVTLGMKGLPGPMEGKVGRVLSASIATQLRAAVEHLVQVLNAGGINITLAQDLDAPDNPIVDTETTAPSARGKSLDMPTPESVAALLADIDTYTR
jgi:hypothetical protein